MSILAKESKVLFLAAKAAKLDPANAKVKEALALLASCSKNAAIVNQAKMLQARTKHG